jgi:SOS-response transcriptional repressor LexA
MSNELTNSETKILSYIISFKMVNGFPPTLSEIARGNYLSKSRVRDLIETLCEKDYITYTETKSRTINVIKFS